MQIFLWEAAAVAAAATIGAAAEAVVATAAAAVAAAAAIGAAAEAVAATAAAAAAAAYKVVGGVLEMSYKDRNKNVVERS